MPKESNRITKCANGTTCIRCGMDCPGGVWACHYNGFRQHALGKGRGIKARNVASAEFCHDCDQWYSEGVNNVDEERASKSIGRSEEFLYWVAMTNVRREQRGDFGGR